MKHEETDIVIVGGGWVGGIIAAELGKKGRDVVMLERGHMRDASDFQRHDELRFAIRNELMQDMGTETWTLRHNLKETALPIRYMGSWRPGTGVGGAGIHWAGQTWRFTDYDFEINSKMVDRYGKSFLPADWSSQDWGVTYDDLEEI